VTGGGKKEIHEKASGFTMKGESLRMEGPILPKGGSVQEKWTLLELRNRVKKSKTRKGEKKAWVDLGRPGSFHGLTTMVQSKSTEIGKAGSRAPVNPYHTQFQ